MKIDTEEIKGKIMGKLPEMLPKVVKSVVVHIVMLIYHVSMPPWVTAIKIKKAVKSRDQENTDMESRRMTRRAGRRRHHRRFEE